MRIIAAIVAISSVTLGAQEVKKVPKDSMRVIVPGCTKGYVFTAGAKKEDQVGRNGVPEGIHLRMNGPKKMINDIKAHEGSMVEITGLMKKGQYAGSGINIGGGVRVGPTGPPVAGTGIGVVRGPVDEGVNYIDVESWRPIAGDCPL